MLIERAGSPERAGIQAGQMGGKPEEGVRQFPPMCEVKQMKGKAAPYGCLAGEGGEAEGEGNFLSSKCWSKKTD